MAILNKIRQRSLFLILIIAMALFSFVLADLFKNSDGFSSKAQNVIASINGEDIKRDDFINKVEAMQRQFGGSMTSTQAMNRVWDQELDAAVLNEQYDALGISVQRDQMRDLLKLGLQSFEEFKNEDPLLDGLLLAAHDFDDFLSRNFEILDHVLKALHRSLISDRLRHLLLEV